jgi:glutamate-1-semialdehyde aminotransferase
MLADSSRDARPLVPLLGRVVPCAEVSFPAESADAARALAIRLARAYSGRHKIFWIADSDALPLGQDFDIATLPSRNIGLVCKAIGESEERIAAIIVAPQRAGDLVLKRFLKRVRELVSAEGALLIWDETLRDAGSIPEYLQASYEIRPDLTCLFQAGTVSHFVGGRADVMELAGNDK